MDSQVTTKSLTENWIRMKSLEEAPSSNGLGFARRCHIVWRQRRPFGMPNPDDFDTPNTLRPQRMEEYCLTCCTASIDLRNMSPNLGPTRFSLGSVFRKASKRRRRQGNIRPVQTSRTCTAADHIAVRGRTKRNSGRGHQAKVIIGRQVRIWNFKKLGCHRPTETAREMLRTKSRRDMSAAPSLQPFLCPLPKSPRRQ